MGQKKDIKLIKKVLKERRHLYSIEELTYMELMLNKMVLERKLKKANKKAAKGFAY